MTRKISINFNDCNIEVTATLLDKEEPEMCNLLWENLSKPIKYFCHHTLSTGQVFLGFPRPPKNRIRTGLQTAPIGRKILMSTQLSPGMIQYTGLFFRIPYGDNITEPAPCAGPVIAIVKNNDLDNLKKAGELVWRREALEHKITTFIVEKIREENN